MNSELQQLLVTSIVQYSPLQIVLNMIVTLILSLIVYYTYKKTYSGVLYSRNFNMTILLISLFTAMVIMIIGGNLTLSLGMVGALSIIRFRSAIKDPRDIGFLFWGIALGLASGSSAYTIAIIGTCLIAIVMFVGNRQRYDDNLYLLILKGRSIDIATAEKTINSHTKKFRLRMRNSVNKQQELIFEVKLTKGHMDLTDALEQLTGTETVHLVTYNGETNG